MKVEAQHQINFLLFIQRILQEGQFTSTYKFALLQSLANVCVEFSREDQPLEIDARILADQFIRLYWQQTLEFRGRVLQQNTKLQARIVTLVQKSSNKHGGSYVSMLRDRPERQRLINNVASTIVEMPLWKLQTIDRHYEEFLYSRGETSSTIIIQPSIAFCFRQFYSLISELTQSAWINFIRALPANQTVIGPESELQTFLFGTDRNVLSKFRPILLEQQHGQCFYCEKEIKNGPAHVDHFIPWCRYRSDLGHNFVVADGTCNSKKRDLLAGVHFLEKWFDRNHREGREMTEVFNSNGLAADLVASERIAFFAYERAYAINANVWPGRTGQVVPLDESWRRVFS